MKLLILKGLPGSGKSTWAKQFVTENKDWIRVNRDDLRNMRGNYWIPKQEDMITEMENQSMVAAFKFGYNVVLDSTNLSQDRNKFRYEQMKALYPNLSVEYKAFDTSVEDCIKNDLKRPNSVGSKVIHEMYNKYFAPETMVYNENSDLPKCVIFDIDGTLAKMNMRGPFDWGRVGEDSLKGEIAELAEMYFSKGYKVILFSGRDGVSRRETEIWLQSNNIPYNDLFMRPEGNNEKDSIIKKRLFEENIRGNYYCKMVVDDRDQVVKMWRHELGLPCLQVDYGDF